MSWNYRVVRRGDELAIYSAYYDDAGRWRARSEHPASITGGTIDELRAELERMAQALAHPILSDDDLPDDGGG